MLVVKLLSFFFLFLGGRVSEMLVEVSVVGDIMASSAILRNAYAILLSIPDYNICY